MVGWANTQGTGQISLPVHKQSALCQLISDCFWLSPVGTASASTISPQLTASSTTQLRVSWRPGVAWSGGGNVLQPTAASDTVVCRHAIALESPCHVTSAWTGVRQGDGISPILFNFALEEALKKIKGMPEGVKLGDKFNILAFADDVAILAERKRDLNRL
ncbi:hypothetical protein J6590_033141 [Homalodisca vitripennis]|nr:hypothetical protein J6590_033141 [Homalodisca vitripennis]